MFTAEEINSILKFIKSSYDRLPLEHRKTFEVLANSDSSIPINQLTFDVRIDRNKIICCLAALEALMLVDFTRSGPGKLYGITALGQQFAVVMLHLTCGEE